MPFVGSSARGATKARLTLGAEAAIKAAGADGNVVRISSQVRRSFR